MAARTAPSAAGPGPEAAGTTAADPRRWLILAVIAAAQVMVVLDLTVMNLALPSAQHALKFTTADRQWVGPRTRCRSGACCCSAGGWPT